MKTPRLKLFDGKTLVDVPWGGWNFPGGSVSQDQIVAVVPWVYRGAQLIANSVASMPFRILDERGEETKLPFQLDWWRTLYLVEWSLLLYGAAYLFKERSRLRIKGLRWVSSHSIQPIVDPWAGLTGFRRRLGNAEELTLTPDDLVYFWLPSSSQEVGPGIAPVQVALEAANIAWQTNQFLGSYFERGMLGSTLLTVDGNVSNDEIRKLEHWWERVTSGISNAWRSVAVRAIVKPVAISSGVEHVPFGELYGEVRNQICAALGIPQTLLEDAANYATAKEHRQSFYEETVLPACSMIEQTLNQQLLVPLGLRLEFEPNQLEIFQEKEAEKSQRIVELVQAGIMTVEEAREWMGLDSSTPAIPDMAEKAIREQRRQEFKRLRDVWKRNPEKVFRPEYLEPAIIEFIRSQLPVIKANIDDIDEDIEQLRKLIQPILRKYNPLVTEALTMGVSADVLLQEFQDELGRVILPALTRITTERLIRTLVDNPIQLDPAVINERALAWAREYGYDLIRGLTETTRRVVAGAVEMFAANPGMTQGDVAALLEPAFGEVRSRMIAVTEVTRTYAQATNFQQELFRDLGIMMERVWQTNDDELVCPICGPLDGQPEDHWVAEFGEGPPAHVNCRCWLTLRVKR